MTRERSTRRLRPVEAFHRWLAAVVLANLIARVIWIAASSSAPLEGPTDQWAYVTIGTKLGMGRRYTAFGAPPLYPMFIGAVVKAQSLLGLPDVSLRVTVGVIQAVLGSGVIVVLALLTRRLVARSARPHLAEVAGLITALWLALWLNQILGSSVLITERLATPMFVAMVACLLWDEEPAPRRVVAVGVLLALLVLARPAYAFTVPVVFAVILTRSSRWSGRGRNALVVSAAAVAVLTPWWLYSASQAGGPLLTGSTSGSFNLCLGNNDDATGTWSDEAAASACPMARAGDQAAADDARLRGRSVSWIVAHPGEQPHLMGERARWIVRGDSDSLRWFPSWFDYQGPGSHRSLEAWSDRWGRVNLWLALPGAAAAVFVLRRDGGWLLLLGASTLVAPMISVGDPRYHEAVMALSAVGLGCLFALALDAWRRRRRPDSAPVSEPVAATS